MRAGADRLADDEYEGGTLAGIERYFSTFEEPFIKGLLKDKGGQHLLFRIEDKQNDILEKFRIKAHLRSYVKDPIIIDERLLQTAVEKLKKLPYKHNDPTDSVAKELVLDAYRSGFFRYEDLTKIGCKLVRISKHRRHHQFVNDRMHHQFQAV